MTLMPGMITCHLHPDFFKFTLAMGMSGERPGNEFPPGVMMAIGVRTCRVLLGSGFTGYVGAACAHNIDAQLKISIDEDRSEEHTSELQSLMRKSYAVFCSNKNTKQTSTT